MVRRSKSAVNAPLIPPESLPCVWMAAGLVSYKLCDRGFDCDHCPLDAALRGDVRPQAPPAPHPAVAPRSGRDVCDFPEDRRYHGHTWARQMDPGRVRCGIDAFAAWLLDPVKSVVLPTPPARLFQGGIACWLGNGAALVPVRSPIAGALLGAHLDVQDHPERVTDSPYAGGWLLELHCPDGVGEIRNLLSASAQRERTRRQLARLEREVGRALHAAADVGATLADGGEQIADLRRLLGEPRFLRLIRGLFR